MNIKTTCSSCTEDVVLDTDTAEVTAEVPSNGLRGSKHVPAHTVTADLTGDWDLLEWECPRCGYPDSYDPHF